MLRFLRKSHLDDVAVKVTRPISNSPKLISNEYQFHSKVHIKFIDFYQISLR